MIERAETVKVACSDGCTTPLCFKRGSDSGWTGDFVNSLDFFLKEDVERERKSRAEWERKLAGEIQKAIGFGYGWQCKCKYCRIVRGLYRQADLDDPLEELSAKEIREKLKEKGLLKKVRDALSDPMKADWTGREADESKADARPQCPNCRAIALCWNCGKVMPSQESREAEVKKE